MGYLKKSTNLYWKMIICYSIHNSLIHLNFLSVGILKTFLSKKMSLNYAITHIQFCSPLPRRSTDICHRSSSFYTWPRPTLFLKPNILSWSNWGRVDRVGLVGNVSPTTHTIYQRPSILKMNKTFTKTNEQIMVKMSKCISTKKR